MRDLELVVLEMESQGKRLRKWLRAGRLNTMTSAEYQDLVEIVERLQYNLTDFSVVHFGPRIPLERPKKQIRRLRVKSTRKSLTAR